MTSPSPDVAEIVAQMKADQAWLHKESNGLGKLLVIASNIREAAAALGRLKAELDEARLALKYGIEQAIDDHKENLAIRSKLESALAASAKREEALRGALIKISNARNDPDLADLDDIISIADRAVLSDGETP